MPRLSLALQTHDSCRSGAGGAVGIRPRQGATVTLASDSLTLAELSPANIRLFVSLLGARCPGQLSYPGAMLGTTNADIQSSQHSQFCTEQFAVRSIESIAHRAVSLTRA